MSPTLALIPAKRVSTGVPDKNWKPIDGALSCVDLAVRVAVSACDRSYVSTDDANTLRAYMILLACRGSVLQRPAELCQPDTPMLDVVKHALAQVPGPDDEIIVLLQPTSPLRSVETVKRAIAMLALDSTATSVVSVRPVRLLPDNWYLRLNDNGGLENIQAVDARRQDADSRVHYLRDGVVYAFRRRNLIDGQPLSWQRGNIYGDHALPLFTPPAESLSIDTPEDWDEAVRRLHQLTVPRAPAE